MYRENWYNHEIKDYSWASDYEDNPDQDYLEEGSILDEIGELKLDRDIDGLFNFICNLTSRFLNYRIYIASDGDIGKNYLEEDFFKAKFIKTFCECMLEYWLVPDKILDQMERYRGQFKDKEILYNELISFIKIKNKSENIKTEKDAMYVFFNCIYVKKMWKFSVSESKLNNN